MGIDVILKVLGRFSRRAQRTDFTIGVQLKSTSQEIKISKRGFISFPRLNKNTYDLFRSPHRPHPYLVILFHLPAEKNMWLDVTSENMTLRKCAYWVDLYGAPTIRAKTPTIYFPAQNLFTPEQFENTILRNYAEYQEVIYEF
jgi:hypothetical protein